MSTILVEVTWHKCYWQAHTRENSIIFPWFPKHVSSQNLWTDNIFPWFPFVPSYSEAARGRLGRAPIVQRRKKDWHLVNRQNYMGLISCHFLRYVKSQHELYILYVLRGCMLIFFSKPYCQDIVSRIIAGITLKEAVRMSSVCSTSRKAWIYHPNLDFDIFSISGTTWK